MKDEKVWIWTRICFYSMLFLWLVAMFVPDSVMESAWYILYAMVWVLSGVTTFVLSIVHLTRHPEKGLAITALAISSFVCFLFVVGFLVGMMEVM